jgi:hypothetical protein
VSPNKKVEGNITEPGSISTESSIYTELISTIFTPEEINFLMCFDLDELISSIFLNKLNIDGGFIRICF